jgi:hypothetical protein
MNELWMSPYLTKKAMAVKEKNFTAVKESKLKMRPHLAEIFKNYLLTSQIN